jgi:alpha-1,3-mannosyltransferase
MFFHTEFARMFKRIYFQTMTRIDLRWVAAVVCDSSQDLNLLRSIVPDRKLHLIPNGIEYERLSEFDLHSRDPDLLIGVGRLIDNKRYDRMLRAFARVLKRRSTARLVIIGPDWGTKSALQGLSTQLGLADHVELAGQISDKELLKYLSRASVWLSSSEYESFGVALLEAMAAGCITVTQPLPAFGQLLAEGDESFCADFDQPDQAADVILQALSLSSRERESVVASARARAARFSWDAIARQFQDLYAEVISTHATR